MNFCTTLSFMLCWWHSVRSHHYLPLHPFCTLQHSVWGFLRHKCLHCYTFMCYQRQGYYGLLGHEQILWDESRMTSALNITVYLHTQTGCLNLFTDSPYSILRYANNLHNALQLSGMPKSTIQQLHVAPWKNKAPCSSCCDVKYFNVFPY